MNLHIPNVITIHKSVVHTDNRPGVNNIKSQSGNKELNNKELCLFTIPARHGSRDNGVCLRLQNDSGNHIVDLNLNNEQLDTLIDLLSPYHTS